MKKVSLDPATAAALDLPAPPRPLPMWARQTIHNQVARALFGPLMRPKFKQLLRYSSSSVALLTGWPAWAERYRQKMERANGSR